MRPVPARVWVMLACLVATPAWAASTNPLAASHDGLLQELQKKLDRHVGAGRVDARTDFIGAKPGDPDPWYWLNPGRAMVVTLVERESPLVRIGWYAEDGLPPVIDGALDQVVFENATMRGATRLFRLPAGVKRFGFYLRQAPRVEHGALHVGAEFTTYTNRLWNSPGTAGSGAMHAPWDGDVQMLVYDVSRWAGPQTWLIACESSDSGAPIGHGPDDTDNDYSDFLFTVSGVGATPTIGTTFGQLKSRFR
jgi:hypothetical protein